MNAIKFFNLFNKATNVTMPLGGLVGGMVALHEDSPFPTKGIAGACMAGPTFMVGAIMGAGAACGATMFFPVTLAAIYKNRAEIKDEVVNFFKE